MICSAKNCNFNTRNCNYSFFRFPIDEKRAKSWALAAGREDLVDIAAELGKGSHRLCETHFDTYTFSMVNSRKRLLANALPTIFPTLEGSSSDSEHNYCIYEVVTKIVTPDSCNENVNFNSQDIDKENSIELFNVNRKLLDEKTQEQKNNIPNIVDHMKYNIIDTVPVDTLKHQYNNLVEENELFKEHLVNATQNCEKYVADFNRRTLEQKNVVELTNIQNICRVCLRKSDKLVSMVGKITIQNEPHEEITITEVLESLISETIELNDDIPDHICTCCIDIIKSFITFKFSYKKSTSILHLYTRGVSKTSDTNISTLIKNDTNEESIKIETNDLAHISDDHDYFKETYNDDKPELEDMTENYDCDTDINNIDEINEKLPITENDFVNISEDNVNTNHTCPMCWTQLPLSQFIEHVKSHKVVEKYLNIPKIPRKARFYASPRDIVGLMSGDNEKIHTCPICKADFKAVEFIKHVDHHLTNDQFVCEKCNRIFKKKRYLMLHMLMHSTDFPFSCATCNKGFVVKRNYECHILTHKDDELPHKCSECGQRFSNPTHLSRHRTIHVENICYSTKYRYKRCKYCFQGFKNKDQLVEHVCQHPGVFGCKYCNKVFTTARARFCHISSQHYKGTNRSGYCCICNITVNNLNAHKIKKHSAEKSKALCTVCGLYFHNIYIHMMKHKDKNIQVKPYKCPVCPKQFAYSYLLKKHLLIHTGLKPYICSYCGKAFNSIYNLQVHERIHIGNRCHVCRICDKGFLEKSYLNKHMKVHKEFSEHSNDIEDETFVDDNIKAASDRQCYDDEYPS